MAIKTKSDAKPVSWLLLKVDCYLSKRWLIKQAKWMVTRKHFPISGNAPGDILNYFKRNIQFVSNILFSLKVKQKNK